MNDQTKNWSSELASWLQQNPRTMPTELQRLRENFVERFPMEKLGEMTLEEYAGGKPDSFCYWLEVKTRDLGSIRGGSSAKFGVWLGRSDNQWHYNTGPFTSPEDALAKLKGGLVTLLQAVKEGQIDNLDTIGNKQLGPNRYTLRSKPLYLYFPDKFLPIAKPADLQYFLSCFGEQPQGDLLTLNRHLLNHLRNLPEFAEFDTRQMMKFLYDRLPPPAKTPDAAREEDIEPDGEPDEDTETLSTELQRLTSLALRTHNIILYGPPGTGKTYIVQQFAQRFLHKQIRTPINAPDTEQHSMGHYYTFVTFHQSFAYEEFVEGLKPRLSKDASITCEHDPISDVLEQSTTSTMEYTIAPGIFKRICQRAEADWQKYPEDTPKYLLIIDEVNRANIAKVFGELITLLEDDKRLGQKNELIVSLPYSGERFGVPPNLYILATMNTADRSIALLDLALRRRFTFMELMPDSTLLKEKIGDVDLQALLDRLNRRIISLLDQDHQIGHSYLLNVHDVDGLRFAWYHRIVPLLQEYFYNDVERIKAVLGKNFVTEMIPDQNLFDPGIDIFDIDRPHYKIRQFEGDDAGLLYALRQLSGG